MDIAKKCRDTLIKYENIIFAYIFGSYFQNKLDVNRDIDVAIYLEKYLNTDEYLKIKMDLSDVFKREVDLVLLNEAPSLLKYEIYKKNVLLFTRDMVIESNHKVKTLFEYNDIKRYLDLSYNKTIERLKEEVKING